MNNNSGDNMNFIANEITGSGLLKGLYTISGNHTAIGNNIKGSLQNGIVSETSLINKKYASQIGTPFKVNSWKNDAYIRNGKVIKTNITTSEPEIKQEVTPKKTETKTVKKRKKKCCLKKKK